MLEELDIELIDTLSIFIARKFLVKFVHKFSYFLKSLLTVFSFFWFKPLGAVGCRWIAPQLIPVRARSFLGGDSLMPLRELGFQCGLEE